jgi:hypothetical protein
MMETLDLIDIDGLPMSYLWDPESLSFAEPYLWAVAILVVIGLVGVLAKKLFAKRRSYFN